MALSLDCMQRWLWETSMLESGVEGCIDLSV